MGSMLMHARIITGRPGFRRVMGARRLLCEGQTGLGHEKGTPVLPKPFNPRTPNRYQSSFF